MSRFRIPIATTATVVALAGFLSPVHLEGQDVKNQNRLLVDIEWLAEHYEDANLVLIQFGPEEDYPKGHIPGAVNLSLDDISTPHDHEDMTSLMLEVPEDGALRQLFRRIGINADSRVVVYWSSEWVTPSSRMMLTLDYAGLGGQSSLLDGGLEAWTAAGLPTTGSIDTPATPAEATSRLATAVPAMTA